MTEFLGGALSGMVMANASYAKTESNIGCSFFYRTFFNLLYSWAISVRLLKI